MRAEQASGGAAVRAARAWRRPRLTRHGLTAPAAALVGACAAATLAQPAHVLQIGNSYTQMTHDALSGFALADPNLQYTGGMAAIGGWYLYDHYNWRYYGVYGGFSLHDILHIQPWDWVILQEYSVQPTHIGDPQQFIRSVQDLAEFIRAECPTAQLALFETWARRADCEYYPNVFTDPHAMQAELRANYALAGSRVGAAVVPVGDAWEIAYELRPFDPHDPHSFTLHQADQSHPNDAGAYLTGAVMYECLFRRSAVGSAYHGTLAPDECAFLQGVAQEVLPGLRRGDLNCDGHVSFLDINPFVLALTDPQGYVAAYADCDILNGDLDGDGRVTFHDINPFVAALAGPDGGPH